MFWELKNQARISPNQVRRGQQYKYHLKTQTMVDTGRRLPMSLPALPHSAGSQPWLPLRVCEAAPAPCPGYSTYPTLTEHHLCCSCPTPVTRLVLHYTSSLAEITAKRIQCHPLFNGLATRKGKLCVHSYTGKLSVGMDTFWKCYGLLLPMTRTHPSVYLLPNAPIYGSKTKYSSETQLQLVFMTVVIKFGFIRRPHTVTR